MEMFPKGGWKGRGKRRGSRSREREGAKICKVFSTSKCVKVE
jgi:hypothetical protein